ncbi:uncharacterized protein LOC121983172 [Zingiber officinale]|uniref:uncharacterized protein LOC121983172 n=1 Tax=Zingiber officinale TaxID=94328 RepID=UPI001C4B9FDD|nr:uncharacterized protein LOC121983172 [Zingiber officinale]
MLPPSLSHSSSRRSSAMVKHGNSRPKKPDNLGKGKVTPVQIAFIVDRYLAANRFDATLAAFRSEASDLFSRTKAKEVPKGLLGLGEILDEYISLKEQRLVMDQEQRRVEMALQGMQEVLRAYHAAGAASLPPSIHLPTQLMAAPVTPILPTLHPSTSGSSTGNATNETPAMKYTQPFTGLAQKSNSMPNSSNVNKRKAMKSLPNHPSEPKKSQINSPNFPSTVGDAALVSKGVFIPETQEQIGISTPNAVSTDLATAFIPTQLLSVVKSSCKQSPDCQTNSSPRTPPQAFQSPVESSGSPLENASMQTSDCAMHKPAAPSNCSILASKSIIASPLKNTEYYAVERSYHIASPYKLNSKSKRGHIKGKLDFDNPFFTTGVHEPVADTSKSSSDNEPTENLDIDLPDLDIFNVDFSFSEFLAEIDLDCEVDPSLQSHSSHVSSIPSSLASVSDKEMDTQGQDYVASVKAVTKFVKILCPVKPNSSKKQTYSPGKE